MWQEPIPGYFEPKAGEARRRDFLGICTMMFEVLMDKQEVIVYMFFAEMKRSDFETLQCFFFCFFFVVELKVCLSFKARVPLKTWHTLFQINTWVFV